MPELFFNDHRIFLINLNKCKKVFVYSSLFCNACNLCIVEGKWYALWKIVVSECWTGSMRRKFLFAYSLNNYNLCKKIYIHYCICATIKMTYQTFNMGKNIFNRQRSLCQGLFERTFYVSISEDVICNCSFLGGSNI